MVQKLVNVELFKAGVDGKFGGNRKLQAFVETESAENLQVGTFAVVTNQFIGDATVVAKGATIPLTDLVQDETPVSFTKIAKGVKVTDEEMKQSFGDPLGNAENQTVKAIEGAQDKAVADLLKTAKFGVEYTTAKLSETAILDAISAMGEGVEDAPYFLLVNPADYSALSSIVKPSDKSELIGQVYGAGLVMSNRIEAGTAFLVQSGAIKEIVQKDTDVEAERKASNKSTEIYTDKIYAVYIQDQSKLVKITKKTGA